MTQSRFYSSVATKTTLNGTISPTAVTMVVASAAGFPGSFPYVLLLERDTANEEIVDVTAATGTTLTVTRGVDGTSGITHTTGAVVEHGTSARDFTEAGVHRGNATIHLPTSVGTNGQVATLVAGLPAWVDSTAGVDPNPWTAYTPIGATGGVACTFTAGDLTGAYKALGKTLHFRIRMNNDPTGGGGAGQWTFSLPVGVTAASDQAVSGAFIMSLPPVGYNGSQYINQLVAVGANTFGLIALSASGLAFVADTNSLHQAFFTGAIEIV